MPLRTEFGAGAAARVPGPVSLAVCECLRAQSRRLTHISGPLASSLRAFLPPNLRLISAARLQDVAHPVARLNPQLRSGCRLPLAMRVDRSTVALWLGHQHVQTTQIYLDATLAMKDSFASTWTNCLTSPHVYSLFARESHTAR
jgi:hypothetical protein